MRLGRIASPDGVAFVSIEGSPDDPAAVVKEIAEHPFGNPTFTGRQWPLADVRLLAPILASKVVCIGKNYAAHIAEMGGGEYADPIIFMKPNTAIVGPNVPIQLPADADPVHFEGELAAVIGRPCKDVPASRVAENILGYTIANDVSARDQQKKDGHLLSRRSVDRHRRRSVRPGDPDGSQRRDQAGQPDVEHDSRCRRRRRMDLGGDDAAAGRSHSDRNPRRCRSAGER
jgi:2-keto-4-pentenoate hydratase/2-oxohepta-3-ene-1,7-dioic acid hydratase in catechol pathway